MSRTLPRLSGRCVSMKDTCMKYGTFLVLGACFAAGSASAQVATGRSNTGMISLSLPTNDSADPKKTLPLTFEIEFSEPSGNKHLEARETGRLRVVMSNTGRTVVRGVVAKVVPLTPPTAVTYNDSILVGDIPANASRYAIFYFTAGESVPSQIVTFQVELFSLQAEAAEPKLLTFLTKDRRGE